MELKKNPAVSIIKERPLFTLLGFIVSFSIAFICFSFTSFSKNKHNTKDKDVTTAEPVELGLFKLEEAEKKQEKKKKVAFEQPPKIKEFEDPDSDPKPDPDPNMNDNGSNGLAVIKDSIITRFVPIVDPQKIFDFGELSIGPRFKYGDEAMDQFIKDNLVYPSHSIAVGAEGRVIVQFVVEKDGGISNIQVVGVNPGYDLDREAIRIVKLLSGKFKPAEHKKRPVRALCRIPIDFEISEY